MSLYTYHLNFLQMDFSFVSVILWPWIHNEKRTRNFVMHYFKCNVFAIWRCKFSWEYVSRHYCGLGPLEAFGHFWFLNFPSFPMVVQLLFWYRLSLNLLFFDRELRNYNVWYLNLRLVLRFLEPLLFGDDGSWFALAILLPQMPFNMVPFSKHMISNDKILKNFINDQFLPK